MESESVFADTWASALKDTLINSRSTTGSRRPLPIYSDVL
jgi:hypothetical protein